MTRVASQLQYSRFGTSGGKFALLFPQLTLEYGTRYRIGQNVWYNDVSMNLSQLLSEIRAYPVGVVEEFKKITWPDRQTTRDLTITVITVVTVATIFVGLLDLAFTEMMALLI